MVRHMGNVPFLDGMSYAEVHRIAKAETLEDVEPGLCLVGVLRHDKELDGKSFLWFKTRRTTTVSKIVKGYFQNRSVRINLHHFGPVNGATLVGDLDRMNDSIVLFKAVLESDIIPFPFPPTPVAESRSPLAPVDSQAHKIATIVKSEDAKQDNRYVLPYARSGCLKPAPLTQLKGENRSMSSLTSIRLPDFSPAPEGFTGSANGEGGSSTFQPPYARVKAEVKSENLSETSSNEDSKISSDEEADNALEENSEGSSGEEVDVGPVVEDSIIPLKEEADHQSNEDVGKATGTSDTAQEPLTNRIQELIESSTPERLEAEVKLYKGLLDSLRVPLAANEAGAQDIHYYLQQVDALRKEQVDSPTIIGVVGNTGAGKSSVINAMLEEERLVPTNCMRACTAVVTELSWNPSEEASSKYRANIEFIQPSDWEKDLRVSLTELMDGNGNVSRDCTNAESEAGIAYAKIKAVYPHKTKEELAKATVEDLMKEPEVKAVLGTIKNIEKPRPEPFYKALQFYVDSKEKSTADSKQKKEKGEKKTMEFWPLIKVVRIYTKADALSTGAVIVDLPGVHDSNAARAAVAAGYMKQCTGLWIVAPINRAVDDKAAKSLLGESFKRQLKYDGTYSRITFICSKSDDISVTEASDSLGLEDQMREDWAKIDSIDEEKAALKKELDGFKESRAVYLDIMTDADEKLEVWEELEKRCDKGDTVFAPSESATKRKRSAEPKGSKKKVKRNKERKSDDDDFIDDDDEEEDSHHSSKSEDEESEKEDDPEAEEPEPLTMEKIETMISQLKEDKKRARQERQALNTKCEETNEKIAALQTTKDTIETAMSAICIEGRNKYSKGAIQLDFAAGIKELDQESAQEDDEDNFDPTVELRDYDEVARSLPVFCCSSRAYQKMSGRMQRDSTVPGFRNKEETEIPQLQQHCKKLTEGVRASNCRRFLTNVSQMLTSLKMWASNDGTGMKLTDTQKGVETRFLQARLKALDAALGKVVEVCLIEMNEALAENIFDNFPDQIEKAVAQALPTAEGWGAPVNKANRLLGGFYWATYKALCRREGIFTNATGSFDLNQQLTEPIIKLLASNWEKAFSRRLPSVLQNYSRKSKNLLIAFHNEIQARGMKHGAGTAGLAMLGQQLRNYEATFVNLVATLSEIITTSQRDANREFTPVIANRLAASYQWCADEYGPGSFKRMKEHMAEHVSGNLDMFKESCDEVKQRLRAMCRVVEEEMANKADEVFMSMQRDYMEVISGNKVNGQQMPKWERALRAEIGKIIEDSEKASEAADSAGLQQSEAENADELPTKEDSAGTAEGSKYSPPLGQSLGDDNAVAVSTALEPQAMDICIAGPSGTS